MEQLIVLQQTVISLLTQNTSPQALIHPNHDVLFTTSTSARNNSVSALAQQYQRMAQSAPIASPLSSSPHGNCFGAVVQCYSIMNLQAEVKCTRCKWRSTHVYYGATSSDSQNISRDELLKRFHARDRGSYRCPICRKDQMGLEEVQSHCLNHSWAEIMGL
jgi:hypothetical protein